MGCVDYAVTFVLIASGFVLAGPWIERHVPALQSVTRAMKGQNQILGIIGMAGGALGFLAIPVFILLMVGFGDLLHQWPVLIAALLELFGCVLTIVAGFLVFRGSAELPENQEAPGQGFAVPPVPTLVGLAAIAYGAFMLLLVMVARFVF